MHDHPRACTAYRPCMLLVTAFDLGHCVYQALKAGVSGFLLKDEPPETLAAAVRTVAAGDALCVAPGDNADDLT